MEVRAFSKAVRVSPRKVRLVADSIRNLPIMEAMKVLHVVPQRAATPLSKTLKSAVANAVNNNKLELNSLVIDRIEVNEGQALKRFRPSTRGRVHPYKKRSSNIEIVLRSVVGPAPVAKPTAEVGAKGEDVLEAEVATAEEPKKAEKKSAKKGAK